MERAKNTFVLWGSVIYTPPGVTRPSGFRIDASAPFPSLPFVRRCFRKHISSAGFRLRVDAVAAIEQFGNNAHPLLRGTVPSVDVQEILVFCRWSQPTFHFGLRRSAEAGEWLVLRLVRLLTV